MPIARPLPPAARERVWLKEVADASDRRAFQHRQVSLLGRFTGQTVFLEGDMGGRSGFYVLSPLAERRSSYVDGAETGLTVLVQQGWVPTRERARNLVLPAHDLVIQGRLASPSRGTESKAAGETGLFRKNLSLQAYASEIGVPLIPMVVLQEPGSEWSEQDIRQDAFQRRWPELYPQDRFMKPKGWALLLAAAVFAGLGVRAWRRRSPAKDSRFAETIPERAGERIGHA
jgi:cytochrome oxidase assembly protein ShyY1